MMEKSPILASPPLQTTSAARLWYVDNLRIVLIILVVLHHLIITYGAPGDWYYRENEADGWYVIPFSMFVVTNQAFFMGMFFLISAYFVPRSYDKKGAWPFLKDRLLRLGMPLFFYYFIISPLTIYYLIKFTRGIDLSFWEYVIEHQGFGFGPMWFVETLLYFTFFYLGYRLLFQSSAGAPKRRIPLPNNLTILLFTLAIGLGSFIVRVWLPVGWSLQPLGLQFPHFTQYISLMILGVFAYRNDWFEAITYQRSLRWFVLAQVFILVLFPVLFYFGGAVSGNIEAFTGGGTWQSLAYAVWEQIVGFALIVALLGIFKKKWNQQGKWAKRLSASAYTVYIIHPPVIIFLAIGLRSLELSPPYKFLLLAPIAAGSCFLLAALIRQLPFARRIL